MQYSSTIFGQLLAFLPREKLRRFTGQHNSEKYVKKLTVWNHLVVLLYAQATGKDSLREIETGLLMNHGTWHHLGINTVSKSSVARGTTLVIQLFLKNYFMHFLNSAN